MNGLGQPLALIIDAHARLMALGIEPIVSWGRLLGRCAVPASTIPWRSSAPSQFHFRMPVARTATD
jgi:hypothetical protein